MTALSDLATRRTALNPAMRTGVGSVAGTLANFASVDDWWTAVTGERVFRPCKIDGGAVQLYDGTPEKGHTIAWLDDASVDVTAALKGLMEAYPDSYIRFFGAVGGGMAKYWLTDMDPDCGYLWRAEYGAVELQNTLGSTCFGGGVSTNKQQTYWRANTVQCQISSITKALFSSGARLTGTVTIASGSLSVAGTGTKFTTEVPTAGGQGTIYLDFYGVPGRYKVSTAPASDTAMTIAALAGTVTTDGTTGVLVGVGTSLSVEAQVGTQLRLSNNPGTIYTVTAAPDLTHCTVTPVPAVASGGATVTPELSVTNATFRRNWQNQSDSDFVTAITVGAGQGINFNFGDPVLLTTTRSHPRTNNDWMGEAFKVLGVRDDTVYCVGELAQHQLYADTAASQCRVQQTGTITTDGTTAVATTSTSQTNNLVAGQTIAITGVTGTYVIASIASGSITFTTIPPTAVAAATFFLDVKRYLNTIPTGRKFDIEGIGFGVHADSTYGPDWRNVSAMIASSFSGHAGIVWNFPFARAHRCWAKGSWAGVLSFRHCPFAKVSNCDFRNQPNALTKAGGGRLGYGVHIYGHSVGMEVLNCTFHEGRHAITTDSATGTLDISKADRWGQPTFFDVHDNYSYGAYGAPWDTHEEASHGMFRNNVSVFPQQGPMDSSYVGFHYHLRGQNMKVLNPTMWGGINGIRIPANESPNSVHEIDDVHAYNMITSSEDGCVIYGDSLAGITNKTKARIGKVTARTCGKVFYADQGHDWTFDQIVHSDIRQYIGEILTGSKVVIKELMADYRDNSAGAAGQGGITLRGSADCRIGKATIYQGATSSFGAGPLFNAADATGTKNCDLADLNVYDPSNVGQFQVVPMATPSRITWGGSDPEVRSVRVTDETINVATGTAVRSFVARRKMYSRDINADLSTASSSGPVTVDVKRNGTSIFGANKLTIDASGTNSLAAATQPTLQAAQTLIKPGDVVTIDVTAAGTGAKGLTVNFVGF